MRQLNRALTLSRMGTVSLLVMCLAMACSDKGTDSNGGSDVTIEPDIRTWTWTPPVPQIIATDRQGASA